MVRNVFHAVASFCLGAAAFGSIGTYISESGDAGGFAHMLWMAVFVVLIGASIFFFAAAVVDAIRQPEEPVQRGQDATL